MSAMWREADMAGETVTTAAESAIRHLFEAVNFCQIGGMEHERSRPSYSPGRSAGGAAGTVVESLDENSAQR